MNTGADHAPLTVTDLDRNERHGGTIFKLKARVRSRPGALSLAVTMAAACLTSCANDNNGDSGSAPTIVASADVDSPSPPRPAGEEIVIKTQIVGFTGKVLTGSVLGGAAFCPGGTVRHDHGSLEIGFPAINVFNCRAGALSIGFGPGPDQMNKAVQTSDWRVLDGTGSFAGATGEGTMRVKFTERDAALGHETFIGEVVVP